MDAMDTLKNGVWGLIFVSLIIATLAIALDAFNTDMDDTLKCDDGYTWNTSNSYCYLSTNASIQGAAYYSTAYDAQIEGLSGTTNASSYLSVIGTMIGVAALIAIVVGAFYFMRR